MNCKITLFVLTLFLWAPILLSAQNFGQLVDQRDGKKYKTIKVDKFEIMAENLAFAEKGICYEMESLFCEDFGRLYSFKEITSSTEKICPKGWHVPTSAEWKYIFTKIGKINTYKFGVNVNLLSNPLNFLPSGYGNGEEPGYVKFLSIQLRGFFASSSKSVVNGEFGDYEQWYVVRSSEEDQESAGNSKKSFRYDLFGTSKDNFLSCRCIKDY